MELYNLNYKLKTEILDFISNFKARFLIFGHMLAVAGTTFNISYKDIYWFCYEIWYILFPIGSIELKPHRMYFVGYEEHSYQIWSYLEKI